jgi:hypothetical protein
MVGRVTSGRLLVPIVVGAAMGACSGAPLPAEPSAAPAAPAPSAPSAADVADDICAPVPGKPPPKPLERTYTGVAAKARCQDEVFKIMGGVTHFLGVKCAFCHLEPDYRAMTHRKRVANWMASELIPRLQKKNGGGDVWCRDCHIVNGKGTTKILGNPRDERWAVEWMTTHLVEDFETRSGAGLRCKNCHQANIGSPDFQRKIILTDRLPKD